VDVLLLTKSTERGTTVGIKRTFKVVEEKNAPGRGTPLDSRKEVSIMGLGGIGVEIKSLNKPKQFWI